MRIIFIGASAKFTPHDRFRGFENSALGRFRTSAGHGQSLALTASVPGIDLVDTLVGRRDAAPVAQRNSSAVIKGTKALRP